MVGAACPCCTPWSMLRGTATRYLYVGQNGNGVSGGVFRIRKFDLAGNQINSNFWSFTPPTSAGQVGRIACDPAGNLYFGTVNVTGSSPGNQLRAIDSAGAALWSKSFGTHQLQGVAVDSSGYVYAGYRELHKYNAATGVEVTTGGWPYTPTGAVFLIAGICVDQVGNTYFCGIRSGGVSGDQVFALDSSGSLLWSMRPSLGGDTTPPNQSSTSIAISADGTTLCVTRSGNVSSGVEYLIDAATGSQISGVVTGDVGGLISCEWDRSGNYYTGTQNRVRKNGSVIATLNLSRPMFVQGLAIGYQDTEIFTGVTINSGSGDQYRVASFDTTSGTKNWSFDDSGTVYGTSNVTCIEYARGRVGAFG